jgi:hypothetical protein
VLDTVERTCENVGADMLAECMGCSRAEALERAAARGWWLDEDGFVQVEKADYELWRINRILQQLQDRKK